MRPRIRAGSWIGASALLGVAACGVEVGDNSYAVTSTNGSPPPGLYTPGNTFGADPNSDGGIAVSQRELTEAMLRNSGGTNNCAPLAADIGLTKDEADTQNANGTAASRPKSPGMMTVSYMTKDQKQRWAPANVGAAWIADPQNRYVRTIELWAAERRSSLGVYNNSTCALPDADVVTQATLVDHSKTHMAKWNGKDIMGNIVPDGQYVLFIEVAETETAFGPRAQVPFTKGLMNDIQNVADTPATTDLKLEYMPTTQAAPGATTGP